MEDMLCSSTERFKIIDANSMASPMKTSADFM